MRSRLLLSLLFAAALVLPASAQEKEPRTIDFEGPEIFCHLLFGDGAEPIGSLDEAIRKPKQALLIVFGNPRILDDIDLTSFLKKGGNVLIASDYPLDLKPLSVKTSGKKITQVEDLAYRKTPQCPWLSFTAANIFGGDRRTDHPLLRFLQHGIATNCPTDIKLDKATSPLESLLDFPFDVTFPDLFMRRGDADLFVERVAGSYMVGSTKDAPPAGRIVVIAGHGMFMNGMMAQFDNDNAAFALNAIRWLRESPDGKTPRQVLFIVDGEVISDFDKKLTLPLPPIPMPTTQMLNRLIRGLEDERFFHRVLDQAMGEQRGRVIGVLIAVTTFVLLLYGTKKFMEGRHLVETHVPRMVGPATAVPAPSRLEQRQGALHRMKDHGEAARYLAQEWFRAELGIMPEMWVGGFVPEFQINSFWESRGRLRRQVDYVVFLANAASSVSRREFQALLGILPRLSQALKDGRLKLLVPGKEVRQDA